MEIKSFIYGSLTVLAVGFTIFGVKQCDHQRKVRKYERKELMELRDQNAELQKDTANYRKLLREASVDLNKLGCSQSYTTQNYKSWEH